MAAHLGELEIVKAALEREGLVLSAEHVGIAIKEICALRAASMGVAVGSYGARDVLAERQRQVEGEGWTHAHDDAHDPGTLAGAASNYALHAATHLHPISAGDGADELPNEAWLWERKWWKPTTPRQDLVKAGALIIAEIDCIDRAEAATAAPLVGSGAGRGAADA